MEKVYDVLVPPGAGFMMATSAVPTVDKSAAKIVALNCVVLTKVVVRAEPFQRTVAPATKPLPCTVNTKLDEPAAVFIGDRLAITGKPLEIGGGGGAVKTVIVPAV